MLFIRCFALEDGNGTQWEVHDRRFPIVFFFFFLSLSLLLYFSPLPSHMTAIRELIGATQDMIRGQEEKEEVEEDKEAKANQEILPHKSSHVLKSDMGERF